jgi:sterol desaturase/sphingolipid hydroxylase (fatty acid hydroxylase superfamily)
MGNVAAWSWETVNRTGLVRFWPYAAAAGIVAVALAMFVAFEPQAASDLWSRVADFVEANWQRALGPGGRMILFTAALVILELFVLSWQKTTVSVVFVQRGWSALSDLFFTIVYFTPLKWVGEYLFSFGLAFGIAKLIDALTAHLKWVRWELPSEGMLEVIGAFSIYFLVTTFVSYWHHRLLHWRWFWYLHRYHHSATEFNVFTGFRENPAAGFVNVLPALSPLILMNVPTTGLFAAFFVAYQMITSLQHSQLPWNFGWIGRWIIVSPQNHQIHHSADEEHRDLNFSVCPLWDRMFGTWYAGSTRPSAYGIGDRAHIERPFTQWLIDIWIFYRDFAQAAARLATSGVDRIGRRPPAQDAPATSIPAE